MFKKILSISILSFICFIAIAQNKYEWKEASANGYTYKYVANDPMQARYYTLKNGLTVILSVNKDEPRLQTLIATKAGSKNDPADHTGLAHYLEHMLFKGTDKYGSKDWDKEKPQLEIIEKLYEKYNSTKDEAGRKTIYHIIDSVSGYASTYAIANEYDKMMSNIGAKGTNAFTSFEQTVYVNDIPSNQIDKWLTIESERFRNPILRLFHTELEAVYEEKNIGMDDDDTKVFETLFAELFKKHNYGLQTTIGTINHLKNPSLVAIKEYYNKNYVPNNMAIIIAGDINPDEIIAKIDSKFSYMQSKPVVPYTFSPEEAITKPRETTVYGPDAEYIQMAYRFPGAATKDAQLLDLMSSILSNGSAGLMDNNLVLKQKVLGCSAGSWALKDYSVLFIEGKAKEGQSLDEVKKLLLEEINNLKTGKFDESMIKAVVANYRKQLIETNESNAGRAYTLLNSFTANTNWADVLATTDYMNTLTKKDIMEFANKYMNDNYVCIYKKIGENKNVQKVEKPPITPIEVNREDQSSFLKSVISMNVTDIQPVFINFEEDIKRGTVKNIPLLTVPNKNNELFELYYVFDMGKNNDKKIPLAVNMLQYLGTDKMSAEQISTKFYNMACNFDVNASDEQIYVSLSGLQENMIPALDLFENLLKYAKPDEEVLKGMIADIIKERQNNKLDKNKITYEAMLNYATYGLKNPYNDVLNNDALNALKASELTDIIHNLSNYKHRILYYGPKSVEEIQSLLIEKHAVGATLKEVPPATVYPHIDVTANNVNFVHFPEMKQAQILWTRNAGAFEPVMVPLINMFNEYFGNGMSAIVFQTIRESKALAYSTFSSYRIPKKASDPFAILSFVGTQSDKFNDAVHAMDELHTTLPLSDKLFETAKLSLKNSISTSRTTKSAILFAYLKAEKLGIDYDIRSKTFSNIDNFTLGDLKEFHANNYSNKAFTYSILGDKNKINPNDLIKIGQVRSLTLEELFGY
ncbi:MAG: insulinase family protein [Bacteroidota bacterium]